jgi:hypothetical protein
VNNFCLFFKRLARFGLPLSPAIVGACHYWRRHSWPVHGWEQAIAMFRSSGKGLKIEAPAALVAQCLLGSGMGIPAARSGQVPGHWQQQAD